MRTSTSSPLRHRRTRAALVGASLLVGALTVAGCAGSGTSSSPTPASSRTETDGVNPAGPVTDVQPNPWGANDCTVLRDVFGDQAMAYGC